MLAAALALAASGIETGQWSGRFAWLLVFCCFPGTWSRGLVRRIWFDGLVDVVTSDGRQSAAGGNRECHMDSRHGGGPDRLLILWTGLVRASRSPLELAATEGATIHRIRFGIWPHWRYWIGVAFFWIAAWIGGEMAITNLFQVTTLTEKCYLSMIAGEWDASSALLTVGFSATSP